MIFTNIDGSSGASNQLLDLLTVVADPEKYKERVEKLEALIAENKRLVELAAPASEIIVLRKQVGEDVQAAKDGLAEADKLAVAIVEKAEKDAAELLSDAREKAKRMREKANEKVAVTDELEARIKEQGKRAEAVMAELQAREAAVTAREAAMAEAEAQLDIERDEVAAMKRALLQKHKEFIESVS